ncbi:MAG: hypothetical protein KGN80_03430 [Acidobacteriota bacterium]|nr:hypothetical protein [Acidobacteriota bacterium]
MIESPEKSSQQIGRESLEALQRYLEALRVEGKGLPSRNGKISPSAIALAIGLDRQALYKNPHCRALLERAAQELGLASIESREGRLPKDDGKDQRIQALETKVASLLAEVHGLRSRLAQFRHIEAHLIVTGRRVIP